MSFTASKLLAIAAAEIGYKEKESNSQLDSKTANAGDNNYTKYARDLHAAGYYQANKNGYAWCDMFVDWCFLQLAGSKEKGEYLECQTGLYGAGCEWSSDCYRRAGRFDKNPQPGDQIFFGKTDDEEHTGIVEKVENGMVYTIEGNASNQVKRCTYSLSSSYIVGYGHPRFDAEEESATGKLTGTASTGSAADEKTIWDFLKGKGLNDYAVAGIMGNLYAESALRSDNLQNTGNNNWNLTDAEYTAQIDAGTRDFEDGQGYGLAQWTYPTRKAALLTFAKAANKSICDLQMQLDFLWKELQGYSAVMSVLKSATSVREASDIFMVKFENPYDKSEKRKEERADKGQSYYDKYAAAAVAPSTPEAPAVTDLKVGDIVEFTGTKHYASANASTGPSCKPGRAKVTAIYKTGKHPYHLIAEKGSGSTVYGWVDVSDIKGLAGSTATENEASAWTPKVGDTVQYNGNTHYTSANATAAKSCKGGKAKITQIYQLGKSKHPYHLVRASGSGATVYGWVDAGSFTKA